MLSPQACFALYIQGAGATAASPVGRDGKEKLSAELRVYCLQVVDDALGNKSVQSGLQLRMTRGLTLAYGMADP